MIKDEHTEPYHPQQNPVELNAIQWLKKHIQLLLDRTNAPPSLWLQAAKYLAEVHNHTAKETLRWEIPLTVRHGDTRDISPFLTYQFMEPVVYRFHELVCQERRYVTSVSVSNSEGNLPAKGFLGRMVVDFG